jgi:ribose 5-phosphate isomerase A
MIAKQVAGEAATARVMPGMRIGLGTGSTVYYTLKKLGEQVRQGLDVQGVATSRQTEQLAREEQIPLLDISQAGALDLTIDGADEFDPALNLIKGGGGALFREKLIASISAELIIVADESKQAQVLGAFPVPVEVTPFGWEITAERIRLLGGKPQLRKTGVATYVTDNGNYLLDCRFGEIARPAELHQQLKALTGVVETGLFTGMASCVYLGRADGSVELLDLRQPSSRA